MRDKPVLITDARPSLDDDLARRRRTYLRLMVVHIVGFLSDGRFPSIRMIGAPGPENGAAQSMQRGSLGMRWKIRLIRRSLGSPRVRNSRQNCSVASSGTCGWLIADQRRPARKESGQPVAGWMARPPRVPNRTIAGIAISPAPMRPSVA